MNTSNSDMRFCVVGCGRLGISLAVFLSKQGFEATGFSSRSLESARNARDFAGSGQVFEDAVEVVKGCPIVFITTPDTTIEPVCRQLADAGAFDESSTVYHLSGALASDILVSAAQKGASTGSIHPLQAFAPYVPDQESPFKGINMSIEGHQRAVELGKEIVNALKANSFTIPTAAKTLYHASAVVASNYLVTLQHFALQLLQACDMSEADAFEILEPLILGTLNNIRARGSVNALTGPVARGDDEIVRRHLADIDDKLPEFSSVYRFLGRYTLDLAGQRGEISDEAKNRLAALFNVASL